MRIEDQTVLGVRVAEMPLRGRNVRVRIPHPESPTFIADAEAMCSTERSLSMQTEYCLGFVFDKGFQSVVLIKKERGLHVGMWNGLGGKVENNETPLDSMKREYREEANDHEIDDWVEVGTLEGKEWKVHVFAAFEPDCVDVWDAWFILENQKGGTLAVILEGYDQLPLAPHVPMLIAGSIERLKKPDTTPFTLYETLSVRL
jgi:hypothetical protein